MANPRVYDNAASDETEQRRGTSTTGGFIGIGTDSVYLKPHTAANEDGATMNRFNGHRWKEYVDNLVTPDFQRFGDVVRTRILPVFDGINKEADDLAKQRYDELMSSAGPHEDWDDGGAIADLAMEAGYDHYDMLVSMRSATLNLYAAAFYHLTEQHIVDLRAMILDEHHRNEISPAVAIEWFKTDLGLNLKNLPSWPMINELMLVANAVKHGEGRSAAELRRLRPDLFVLPQFKGRGIGTHRLRVRKPLFGQDIYVSADDFAKYHDGSVVFWNEMAAALPDLTR